MDYVVRTEGFEGPFDLLLHLIARQQVDLWQVSISRITEDYLAEIRRMRSLDLEVATEFLLVAATLVELKAARLLPSGDGDEEVEALLEERDLLFARLLQYRAYKLLGGVLAARMAGQEAFHERRAAPEEFVGQVRPHSLAGVTARRLAELAAGALVAEEPPALTTAHLAPPRLSVAETVGDLAVRIRAEGETTFALLVGEHPLPVRVVVSFLALLELAKRSLVSLEQERAFADIAVRWTPAPDLAASELPA